MSSDLDARRAARRAAMPITTQILADYEQWGATVIWAEEGEHKFGKREEPKSVFTVPANYHPTRTIERKK